MKSQSAISYTATIGGGVAEWFKAAVLKTAVLQGTVGSNPTPSARNRNRILKPKWGRAEARVLWYD